MRIFQFIKHVMQVIAGGDALIVSEPKPAARQTTLLEATLDNPLAAVALTLAPSEVRINTTPGATVALLGVDGAAGQNAANAGAAQTTNLEALLALQSPAGKITQMTFELNKRAGANAVTETAVATRTDWASDASAQGIHDGVSATFAGNALGARGGQLELDYANSSGKSELIITSAKLHFYISVGGTLANNADVQLKYNIGGGFVTLQTITGNVSNLTTPITHDLTGVLTTWTQFDSLRTACYASSALAETWTVNLDAIEVEITASLTDTL